MTEEMFFRWSEKVPYPEPHKLPDGLRARVAHRADSEFPFLHDTMIAQADGKLLMGWYNCTQDEMIGRTVIRGRRSADNGETWSDPEVIAEDDAQAGIHFVPVTFCQTPGGAYAFTTRMTAPDRPIGYIASRRTEKGWKQVAAFDDLLLLNTIPQKLRDGRFLAAGRMAVKLGEFPRLPVVATADDCEKGWKIQPLPGPWNDGVYPLSCPETTVAAQDELAQALTRNDAGRAQMFFSVDDAQTWQGPFECRLPIAPSKMCAGRLSDGRQYLIYNERTPARDRSRLVLAVRPSLTRAFDRLYLVHEGYDAALDAGPFWHYPCACESGGMLHISCSASGRGVARHAALFSVPLDAI